MRMNIYAVLDKAVEAYLPLFLARAHGEASRMFMSALGDGRPNKAPASDLTLFHIGFWDDSTGVLEPLNAPDRVLTGLAALGQLQREHDLREASRGKPDGDIGLE